MVFPNALSPIEGTPFSDSPPSNIASGYGPTITPERRTYDNLTDDIKEWEQGSWTFTNPEAWNWDQSQVEEYLVSLLRGSVPDHGLMATPDTVNDDSIEEWEYESWSITNPAAWNWSQDKIEEYLKRACMKPSRSRVQHQWLVNDLAHIYSQIILPAMGKGVPYIVDDDKSLRTIDVHSRHGITIPITDFYSALAWIITITESPALRPIDHKRFLCYLVRWSAIMSDGSHTGMSSEAAIPATACIYWMDIPAGMWQDLYGSHRQILSVSFSLSNRVVKRDSCNVDVKEQARLHREEHLVENVGHLPPEPRAKLMSFVDGNTRWGHCAETLTLTSIMLSDHRKCVFNTLAIGTAGAIERFNKLPSYRADAISVNVFKKMCGNCNELMQQVGRNAGWDDPKEGYVDHFIEMREREINRKRDEKRNIKAAQKAKSKKAGSSRKVSSTGGDV